MPAVVQRAKAMVAGTAIENLARRVWQSIHARGWTDWKPLIPETAFRDCVLESIRRLRELEPDEEFGEYLEFGVSRGASLACVAQVLREVGLQGTRLIGFDSFKGMPSEAAHEGWAPGSFYSTVAATRRFLKEQQIDLDRVILVEGWFKDTLNNETRERLGMGKASLIMVDCDIYTASREALAFCGPHIGRHAVIMFDDWGWRANPGEVGQKEAFAEFLNDYPDISAEPMPSYRSQARVYLLRRRASTAELLTNERAG